MADSSSVEASIKFSLQKNGFPEKIVRFPFKPVYDTCKKYGVSLTEVLENLRKDQILGRVDGDHIEFKSFEKARETAEKASHQESAPTDFSQFQGMDPSQIQAAAQETMSKMSPEQLAEIRKMVDSMSDEEKQNIMKMFSQGKDS